MVRKRWRLKRTMVVPAQWQGSVERFYHFLLGYFMPTVLWQERTGSLDFAVRDCGPMNPWFDLLRPGTQLDVLPPGVMLQRVLTHLQEYTVLHDWDNPTRFHRASLRSFSTTIVERLDAVCLNGPSQPRIVVLDRRPGVDVFASGPAEVAGSGSDSRSIPNMSSVADALSQFGLVEFVDTAGLSPAEQVRAVAGARLLVAQHGAGLANMVWLRQGAAVLEIQPPLPPIIDRIYPNLAAGCQVDHASVPQSDDHAAVDVGAVVDAASALMSTPGAFIPQAPGRLPTRIRHQLPRRL